MTERNAPSPTSKEDILPPNEPAFSGHIGETYKTSVAAWPQPTRAKSDAPNVLIVMFDDLGFGQSSAFGGPVNMPNVERLASSGARFNNFHTTALCSPTRAALLTGRNHHSVGFASIAEMSTGFPGANAYLPKTAASLAEVLKLSGYSTMAIGKWHLTPSAHVSAAGPFDRWPLGLGFERYYGFLPGETDHWHPMLTCDNHRIKTPRTDGYHLSEDLADQAIQMLQNQQQVATGKPFFMYVAFGAPHCPFHVDQKYIDRYKGKFDQGWDVVREETFSRQLAMGIIPTGSKLPERNPGVKPWAELNKDERRLFARLQETFAGFVEHTDEQLGRVLDALDDMDIADNTVVMFLSDNGASQEGGVFGSTNTERFRNMMPMSVAEMLPDLDRIGDHTTDPHYPAGWGMAGNAPFKRWKRDTHRGGNTDPLVIRWPAGFAAVGDVRSQYLHVTDIYPTVLELAGIRPPSRVHGIAQMPLEGQTFAYALRKGQAPRQKKVQYYEMMGSRAIWADGWTAVAWHKPQTDWSQETWELYHQDQDYTQCVDLAGEYPEKLQALIKLWFEEAKAHNVFPLDDRGRERAVDRTRPLACLPQSRYVYYPNTVPVPFNAVPRLLRRKHRITAALDIPRGGASGVIIAEGSAFGGWSLFIQGSRAHYVHNCLKLSMHQLTSSIPVPFGKVILEFEFEPTGSLSGKPLDLARPRNDLVFAPGEPAKGNGKMRINGQDVGRLENILTAPLMYSFVAEGFQIGENWGTPVAYQHYQDGFKFTGKIQSVIVEVEVET
jgi:arylsulfatase